MRMNSGNAGRSRTARRLALGLAVAAGTLAATASAAVAAPRAVVAPSVNLDRAAPNALSVTGTGYTTDAVDPVLGLYVAVTAVVNGEIVYDMPNGDHISTTYPAGPRRLNADGSFAAAVTVNRRFTLGPTEVDCAVTQCFLTTWRAHGAPTTANTLTQKAILFRAAAPGTPEVTVAPRIDLPREGETTVTISGTGFDPSTAGGNGFYIGYGPRLADYWRSTRAYGATKWIRPGATPSASQDVLNPDGSFRTTLTLTPSYERDSVAYDCRVIACEIITFAAQGSADRTFDTSTPITFAPVPPPPPVATVSPTTGLNRDAATTVTVNGSNFATGTYIALTATVNGQVLTAPQDSSRWVRRGGPTPAETLNADGTFATTVSVTPTFTSGTTTVDCRVTQCAIATWRQHSNPTPATLYTTTPIAFAAAPIVTPPVRREDPQVPAPKPPAFKPVKPQGIAKNRTAKVAILTCGGVDCKVTVPRSVTFKIGKKRYRAAVTAPESVKAGRRAEVRVKLTKAAVKALKGRTAKLKVKITVVADGKSVVKTSSVTLRGAKKKPAASGG